MKESIDIKVEHSFSMNTSLKTASEDEQKSPIKKKVKETRGRPRLNKNIEKAVTQQLQIKEEPSSPSKYIKNEEMDLSWRSDPNDKTKCKKRIFFSHKNIYIFLNFLIIF